MTDQTLDIDELFKAGKPIDDVVKQATREAVKRHRQAQQPVAGWKDGKIVWLSASTNEGIADR
jgi:hypothetical protein